MKGVRGIINPEDINSNNQDDLQLKSTGRLFMNYISKIIVGLFSYLQDHDDKEIEALFSNAIDVFNALGSWVYGGCSPKIVYPDLQLFVNKANISTTENFSHLLDYINWVGNELYKLLEENQWIEEHYYESFTLKQSNDVTTGLLFMWRLGWLIEKMKDISKENNAPTLLQSYEIFNNLFDAFGRWIYNQEGLINITRSFHVFKKIFEAKFDPVYNELLEETKNTKENIAKFLQNLKK